MPITNDQMIGTVASIFVSSELDKCENSDSKVICFVGRYRDPACFSTINLGLLITPSTQLYSFFTPSITPLIKQIDTIKSKTAS